MTDPTGPTEPAPAPEDPVAALPPAPVSVAYVPRPPVRRRWASPSGTAVVAALLALGVAAAVYGFVAWGGAGRATPASYDPPAIPGVVRETAAAPRASPRPKKPRPASTPAADPTPAPTSAAPLPAHASEPAPQGTSPAAAPLPPPAVTPDASGPAATPPPSAAPSAPPSPAPPESVAATPPPSAPDPALPPPAPEVPVAPGPVLSVRVTGAEAEVVARAASERSEASSTPTGPPSPRITALGADGAAGPADALTVEVLPDGLRVVASVRPSPGKDPVADLVPPAGLVGPILEGARLPVAPAARGAALAALARLFARDGVGAQRSLDGVPPTPGVRVLRAYAALVGRTLPVVHETLFGLGEDVDLGPLARVLTGAALRADGNPREAVRDFEAAVRARPAWWPARLLAAEAYETEDLHLLDRAAESYAAAADGAPREPAVVLGHAYYRVLAKDRAGARASVERLLAEHPGVVAGWRLLAWIRTDGGTSEDTRAAVLALEEVARLEPEDARAWGELGGARWKWSAAGGGAAALEGAADAFGRQATLSPRDGLAWFNRGGALHQAALSTPLAGDAAPFLARLAQARLAYARALAAGLRRTDAARVHFNVGLLLETSPTTVVAADGLASRASDAFDSAVLADPAYLAAGLALVAARVAERDAAAATKALTSLPPGTDPRERAALEAAAAWVAGDAARARSLLSGPGGVAIEGPDPLPALGRTLLVLGYRRAAASVLEGETADPARLALRLRAHAGLRDLVALRSDLEALAAVDAAAAKELRASDPDVLAALGPAPAPVPAPARDG